MKKSLTTLFLLSIWSNLAFSGLIEMGESQDIVKDAQSFTFTFDATKSSNGAGGLLTVRASGDYTADDVPKHSAINSQENLSIVFESGLGSVLLDESGVLSNSVAGLSLLSFESQRVYYVFDTSFTAIFSLSANLLDQLLADQTVEFEAVNGRTVGRFFYFGKENTDRDYVEVSLSYNELASSAIPSPASASLIILGLGLLLFRRRTSLTYSERV